MLRYLPLLVFGVCGGCIVTQPQDTPVSESRQVEPSTGRPYWLYVPSYYSPRQSWPLVITLHGTHGWDSAHAQIREWKALAEQRGLIVAAPQLKSTQDVLPVIRSLWAKDLAADEQAVLATLEEVSSRYHIDGRSILLTGFSAGGYVLYYTGLRHPDRFSMLIAREASFRDDLLEGLAPSEQALKMPIMIFWGKDEFAPIRKQSWRAYRRLREQKFVNTRHKEVEGGQLRRPDLAYRFWAENSARVRAQR
jgi:poly(3-hydroxybutyrate) depolymerase